MHSASVPRHGARILGLFASWPPPSGAIYPDFYDLDRREPIPDEERVPEYHKKRLKYLETELWRKEFGSAFEKGRNTQADVGDATATEETRARVKGSLKATLDEAGKADDEGEE